MDIIANITPESVVQFLLTPPQSGWLILVKVLFLLLDLGMIVFIIYALSKTSWLNKILLYDVQEFLTYKHFGLSKIRKKWEEIKKDLESGTEPEMKLSLVEADSLLDSVLRIMGYSGKDMTSRLEKINTNIIEDLEDLKEYHKIYLNIVHDPTYRLNSKLAEEALKAYRKALVDLDVL